MPVYQVEVSGYLDVLAESEEEARRLWPLHAANRLDRCELEVLRQTTLSDDMADCAVWDGEPVSLDDYERRRTMAAIERGHQSWHPPDSWPRLLASVCDPHGAEYGREWMERPWAMDGGAAATSGHGFVWRRGIEAPVEERAPVAAALRWLDGRPEGQHVVPVSALREWAMRSNCSTCGDEWDPRCPRPRGSRDHVATIAGWPFDRRLVAQCIVAPALLAEQAEVCLELHAGTQLIVRAGDWWSSVMGVGLEDAELARIAAERELLR